MDIRDVGAELRSSREARGLSIDHVSKRTRVQPRYLTAIEHNDLSVIPPKPFGRGFVRAYATEVGLDPEMTVRDYFARFAPPPPAVEPIPPPEVAPLRIAPWALAVVAAAAIGIVSIFTMGRDTAPTPAAEAVGTAGTPSAGAPAPAPVAGSGAVPPAAAPAIPSPPKTRPVEVALAVSRPCWITATADGRRAIYALLQPGTREKLTADREIVIRAGDAGALTWSVNGRDAVEFGAPGEVRTVKVTADGIATVR
jgi:cytoskeletal protein RodZ